MLSHYYSIFSLGGKLSYADPDSCVCMRAPSIPPISLTLRLVRFSWKSKVLLSSLCWFAGVSENRISVGAVYRLTLRIFFSDRWGIAFCVCNATHSVRRFNHFLHAQCKTKTSHYARRYFHECVIQCAKKHQTRHVCVGGDHCDVALEGGPYTHKYRVAQFHFHWGKTSQEGAEHLIDGKVYAAEVSND